MKTKDKKQNPSIQFFTEVQGLILIERNGMNYAKVYMYLARTVLVNVFVFHVDVVFLSYSNLHMGHFFGTPCSCLKTLLRSRVCIEILPRERDSIRLH